VSPDGETANKIDHILIDERRGTISIIDVRSMRGISYVSDHHLVRATLRCRLMTHKQTAKNALKKIIVEALNDLKIATILSKVYKCKT
jgi:hypothetical protein